MLFLLPLLLTLALVTGRKEAPSPSNDELTATELLHYCEPWGKMQIYIKNKNGTFTLLDKVPYDLICEVFGHDVCEMKDGQLEPKDPADRNITLVTVGLYGLGSLTTPEFAKLIVFKTKTNHTDVGEQFMTNGCEGTMHEDKLPPPGVKWLAFMKRGECYFTQKLSNAVETHGADGFVLYNDNDNKKKVIMNLSTPGLTTMMINNSIGVNIEGLQLILHTWWNHFPNSTLPYTNELYTNISFNHCKSEETKEPTPLAVTIVTITFVIVMILALAWLVVYYFQKHRNANKQVIIQIKYQKAAKKALKKIGERVIEDTDSESRIDNQEDCTYCLEPLMVGETIRQLPCRHKFHKDCVDDWLIHNRTCPNCHNNILVATGVTIRGIKHRSSEDDDGQSTELTDLTPESRQQLLSDSQPIAGHEEAAANDSQYWGSQVIPGSQLLTDGQNVFLYVPNDVELPTDTTIQIENPPPTLARSHQQLVAAALAEKQQLLEREQMAEKLGDDSAM